MFSAEVDQSRHIELATGLLAGFDEFVDEHRTNEGITFVVLFAEVFDILSGVFDNNI